MVADVVILLERSIHYPSSYEKTGARTKTSLLELHASDAWFRADKQGHEVVVTDGRAPGIWAVRKGDHMQRRATLPDLSPYYIVHFARSL